MEINGNGARAAGKFLQERENKKGTLFSVPCTLGLVRRE
jgi:hypothetical protein